MTPDTCPHCGAEPQGASRGWEQWFCGTHWIEVAPGRWKTHQSPECARYVRTRISQLRRMAEGAASARNRAGYYSEKHRGEFLSIERDEAIRSRLQQFQNACIREIDRLRGGA